jgi:hypothetical protein
MFRKLDRFPTSGEGREASTLLGLSERANPNPVILSVIDHSQNPLDSVSDNFLHVSVLIALCLQQLQAWTNVFLTDYSYLSIVIV